MKVFPLKNSSICEEYDQENNFKISEKKHWLLFSEGKRNMLKWAKKYFDLQ